MVSTKKTSIEYTHRKTRRESECITTRKAVMENLRDKQTIRNTENKS